MLKNLKKLHSLNEQRRHINKIIESLYEPLLVDKNFITDIWNMCDKDNADLSPTEKRQVFLTVIALFYSPQKLAGGKFTKSVMRAICETTGTDGTLISHNSESLIFLYERYKAHRERVDALNGKIMDVLVEKGLVKRDVLLGYLSMFLT